MTLVFLLGFVKSKKIQNRHTLLVKMKVLKIWRMNPAHKAQQVLIIALSSLICVEFE
jgi:hypothetical protein